MCSSPRLLAAYHGLHRTVAPRHPPWTLSRLTIFSQLPRGSHPGVLLALVSPTLRPATVYRGIRSARARVLSFRCQWTDSYAFVLFTIPSSRPRPTVGARPRRQNGVFSLPLSCQRTPPQYSVELPRSPVESPPQRAVRCVTWSRQRAPLVGLVRVELTTSRLSGVRSNHLSYRPR